MVDNSGLSVRALKENSRPTASTKLSVAPYWNMNDQGDVCMGTARRPTKKGVSGIADWERCFWESEFTHPSGAHSLTKFKGGFCALWRSLKGKKKFPVETLVDSGEQLGSWIRTQ
jgi:PRTRC genetic system protein B